MGGGDAAASGCVGGGVPAERKPRTASLAFPSPPPSAPAVAPGGPAPPAGNPFSNVFGVPSIINGCRCAGATLRPGKKVKRERERREVRGRDKDMGQVLNWDEYAKTACGELEDSLPFWLLAPLNSRAQVANRQPPASSPGKPKTLPCLGSSYSRLRRRFNNTRTFLPVGLTRKAIIGTAAVQRDHEQRARWAHNAAGGSPVCRMGVSSCGDSCRGDVADV